MRSERLKTIGNSLYKNIIRILQCNEKRAYLKAPPRPCLDPRPPKGEEKKSCSVSKSKTLLLNKLSDMSKKEAKGLLEPKN